MTSFPIQLVTFTKSSAGLEKSLRLIHALALIAANVISDADTAVKCAIAASQLALGRRYFRLLDFIGCFESVSELLAHDVSFRGYMVMAESTLLGIYCFLENFTILHDMGVWHVSWYTPFLIEANKFWFYSICLSLARGIYTLLLGTAASSKVQQPVAGTTNPIKEEPNASSPAEAVPSKIPILKQLVVDSCDLILPGSFIGWTPVGDLGIGITMVISTLVISRDLWATMQR